MPDAGEDSLKGTLRVIAEEDASLDVSAECAATLVGAVRAVGARRRRRVVMVAAAAVLAVAAIVRYPSPPPLTPPAAAAQPALTGYLPLVYGDLPMTESRVVRVAVPRTALLAFGVGATDSMEPSDVVLADVIVGEDGLARAVKFVERSQ